MALKPLNVKVNADTDGLDKGLLGASQSVDQFSNRTKVAAVNVAKAAAAMTVAVAAVGAGVLKAANEAAQFGVQIQNLANVAGISTTEFQRMAAASRTVGIEQDKLSDILKDVNDKFGDFQATGAGPLADFFENIAPQIGVTADQFARLSGPEALQLYVSSLEQAGVSQQQMTFYMEALASDATALVPLLMNGGAAMRSLGNEAERTGRVLDEEAIRGAVELDRKLQELSDTLRTKATATVLEYSDELIYAADVILEKFIPAMGRVFDAVAGFVDDIGNAIKAINDFSEAALGMPIFGEGVDPGIVTGGMGGTGLRTESLTAAGREALGLPPLAPEDDPRFVGPIAPPLQMTITPNFVSTGPIANPSRSGSGGGGSGGASGLPSSEQLAEELATRLETLTDGLATESELIQEWYNQGVQTLADAKAAELLTEEDYRQQRERLEKEHQSRINAIKKAGAMADLSLLVGAGAEVLGALGQSNEKALKMSQVFGAAQALISAYQGAAEALKLPFPGNVAAAATVLAKGIGFVTAIKGVSKGGGGGGGGASAGAAAPVAAAAQPSTQNVVIDLVGASGQQVDNFQQFADTLNEAARQGLLTNLSVRGA
jgi:hypothetical protein